MFYIPRIKFLRITQSLDEKAVLQLALLFLLALCGNAQALQITGEQVTAGAGRQVSVRIMAGEYEDKEITATMFTLHYSADYFTLTDVESLFFAPIISYGELTYNTPLVYNTTVTDKEAATMAAAFAMDPGTPSTLATFTFTVSDETPVGEYPITITASTIYNKLDIDLTTTEEGNILPLFVYYEYPYKGQDFLNYNTSGDPGGADYDAETVDGLITVVADDLVSLTVSNGENGEITPRGVVNVALNSKPVFTLTPDIGYEAAVTITEGNCTGTLDGNTYTLDAVTEDCSLAATFTQKSLTITSSAESGGTISPEGETTVAGGEEQAFTLTADEGYSLARVDITEGSCTGTLDSTTFTLDPVDDDCTIVAYFSDTSYTLTSSAGDGGTITPEGDSTVVAGSVPTYTVTPDTGYDLSNVSVTAGDCTGTLSGTTYTFDPIPGDCTLAATFSLQTFTITANAGDNGTISPNGDNTVTYGTKPIFTLTPDSGYAVSNVSVTAGDYTGTLSGTLYTLDAVTDDCTIVASFLDNIYTITTSADTGGTITPYGESSVVKGSAPNYTLIPERGYKITGVAITDGECTGTLNGDIFTLEPVEDDCALCAYFKKESHLLKLWFPAILQGVLQHNAEKEKEEE